MSGEVVITYNPATEEPLAEVAKGSAEDADRAITAADRAHRKVWSKMEPRERAKYLYRISRIMQERSREFAVTETLDSGSRFANRATLMCRSPPRTSGTTPDGRTNCSTPSPDADPSRTAWLVR